MKQLIKFSKDYADEFQCEQFTIVNSVKEAKERISEILGYEYGAYFGTNEGWEADELDSSDFTVQKISDAQAAVIEKYLGNTFGTGIL